MQFNGTTTVAVTGLARGSAFNPRGEDFSDRDNAGCETGTIDDDAGRTVETIQNYALDVDGQPLTDADTNLTSATTYHVTQQIASTGTLSPNGTGVTVSVSGSLTLVLPVDTVSGGVEQPGGGVFVMARSGSELPSGTILAKYDNGGWSYWHSGAWTSFTATFSDVLVARLGAFTTGGATIAPLEGIFGTYEGVQSGYKSGDLASFAVGASYVSPGTAASFTITFDGTEVEPYYLAQTSLDIYGTGIGDSSPAVWRNDLLRAVIYADSSATWDDVEGGTGGDFVEYTYDRQGETTSMENQDLVLHDYTHDGLGHETSDTVSLPYGNPANIDTTVTELAFAYKVCGRFLSATSLDANGNVVNQVLDDYDANGDLDKIYQEHGGPVDTSTSEYVAYGYDETTSSVDDPALGGYVTMAAYGIPPDDAAISDDGDE